MSEEPEDSEPCDCDNKFGTYCGKALCIAAFLIGMGGCDYLAYLGEARNTEAQAKLKAAEHQAK